MDVKIKQALIDIIDENNCTDSLIDRVSYSYDASVYSQRPSCAVWVETVDMVSRTF